MPINGGSDARHAPWKATSANRRAPPLPTSSPAEDIGADIRPNLDEFWPIWEVLVAKFGSQLADFGPIWQMMAKVWQMLLSFDRTWPKVGQV